MPKVDFEYEEGLENLDFPEGTCVIERVPESQVHPPLSDPASALDTALENPIGTAPLQDLVSKDSRIAITLNDWMGGNYYALPAILRLLKLRQVPVKNIRIMIAGGTHAKVTRNQLYVSNMGRWAASNHPPFKEGFRIVPPEIIEAWSLPGRDRIERHDCSDERVLVELGLTETGQLLEVNSILTECDLLIHSGWGPLPLSPWGGVLGSGIVLGLSSARAILGHHSARVINHPSGTHGDPQCQLYAKHKVRLMEKLEQSISARLFLIDPFFNSNGDFAETWWAGDWSKLREQQIPHALSEFCVQVPCGADIVIMDCPPWMFHGSTDNPLLAMSHVAATLRAFLPPNPILRKGGVVVCITSCHGTIDDWYRPSDREALSLYAKLNRNVDELFDRYAEDFLYRPEYVHKYRHAYGHHALHAFWLLAAEQYVFEQSAKVIFAGARESEGLRQMGITPMPDLRSAWQMALAECGKTRPDITVFPRCSKRLGLICNVRQG